MMILQLTRFNEFLKGLDTDESSFYQPSQISFSKSQNQTRVIQSKQILKDDCRLFSTIFTSCQSREYDVFDIIDGNAFINADPSKMMKLASGSVSGGVTCVSRIVASCDF
jgi:hypothetical protein